MRLRLLALALLRGIVPATQFQTAGVPFELPRAETFLDSDTGHLVLAILRIVCHADDYVAHRTVLGRLPGVGVGTCNSIADEANTASQVAVRALRAGVEEKGMSE